jgi:hypothetical protein
MTETASFCELNDRKSFILWDIQWKQLHSVPGMTEKALFCEVYNRNSFILWDVWIEKASFWDAWQKKLHSVSHTTETALFCELHNRNSCILWEVKHLLPVTGKPETASFCDRNSLIPQEVQQKEPHSLSCTIERVSYCEPFNRNSIILWVALQKQLYSVIHTTGTASLRECMTEIASFCELHYRKQLHSVRCMTESQVKFCWFPTASLSSKHSRSEWIVTKWTSSPSYIMVPQNA